MSQFFWPAAAFVVVSIVALIFMSVVYSMLRRWHGQGVEVFLSAIRLPSILWCIVLGLFVGISLVEDLPPRIAAQLRVILEAAVVVSATITVAGVLGSLAAAASERQAWHGGVTGIVRSTVQGAVLLIGLVILLASLGVEITPLVTALGVGGLALALALQDTLSNVFAGMHLLADRPIRVRDWVKIGDALEGQVVDVSWRSTRVRTLLNNVVIVPNKRVAESIIINYDLPESRLVALVHVGVSYASDPDRVEQVLADEARRAVGELDGLLAEPPPVARLTPGLGAYALEFTLAVNVDGFANTFRVQSELRKRVVRRLRAEGIEIPYPVQTVELRGK